MINELVSTLAKALSHHGYMSLPYRENLKKQLVKVMDVLQKFCEQPLREKEKFTYIAGGGYEYKGPNELDYKENFHVSLAYFPGALIELTAIDKELLDESKKFLHMSVEYVKEACLVFNTFLDFDITPMVLESLDDWTLRLLHYPARDRDDKLLAFPHPDKTGFTIHWADSMPGLQAFWNGEWKDVSHMNDHMVIFPALGVQFHTKSLLKALLHQVIASLEIKGDSRYSIISFIGFGTNHYDKETFGNTRKVFSKAENYSMSQEKFEEYFTATESAL